MLLNKIIENGIYLVGVVRTNFVLEGKVYSRYGYPDITGHANNVPETARIISTISVGGKSIRETNS